MRLLILSPVQGGLGGGEVAISMVANALWDRKIDVVVALEGPSLDRRWEDRLPRRVVGPLSREGGRRRHFGALAHWLRSTLQTVRPDAILALDPIEVGLCAALGWRQRTVSWCHSLPSALPRPRILLRLARGHLAVSNGVAAELRAIGCRRVAVVYNPIRANLFDRSLYDARSQRLVFAGRLTAEKRVEDLLYAVAQEGQEDWSVVIFGSGPCEKPLRALASSLRVSERVQWMGWKDDPWDLPFRVRAVVLPSTVEAFGLVLAEGAACGLPLIAPAENSGAADVIVPGVNGWRYQGGIGGLVSALNTLKDPTSLVGTEAIRGTARRFELDNVADGIVRHVATLIGHSM